MARRRHVLAEHDGDRQERSHRQRRKADELHRDARGAGRLTPRRIALPAIDPAAFARRKAGARVMRVSGATMGTGWSAQIVAPPPGLAAALSTTLTRMIAAMSQWEPASALSAFNRSAIGEWEDIPDVLAEVLNAGLAIGAKTGGAFDPTTGALTDLWGFGPPGAREDVPEHSAIADARIRSGIDAIEIDGHRARRTRDVQLDLSGIGKGRAVDALAATCREHGCNDFLVEIGGEFVGSGVQPSSQPWWVDLETPPGTMVAPLRIAAHGVAIATSGNYRRFLRAGNRKFSHTIDPRTGRPIANAIASVSVIAGDCMTADGWATALTVLGRDAGMVLADREGLAVQMVMDDGRELLSPALRAMID